MIMQTMQPLKREKTIPLSAYDHNQVERYN